MASCSSAWFPANTVILNNLLKLMHNPGFLEIQFSGRILNLEDCVRERTNSKFCEIKELKKKLKIEILQLLCDTEARS